MNFYLTPVTSGVTCVETVGATVLTSGVTCATVSGCSASPATDGAVSL